MDESLDHVYILQNSLMSYIHFAVLQCGVECNRCVLVKPNLSQFILKSRFLLIPPVWAKSCTLD